MFSHLLQLTQKFLGEKERITKTYERQPRSQGCLGRKMRDEINDSWKSITFGA